MIKPAEDPKNPAPEPATSTPPAQPEVTEDQVFFFMGEPDVVHNNLHNRKSGRLTSRPWNVEHLRLFYA